MFFTGPFINMPHPTAEFALRDRTVAAAAAVRWSRMDNTQPLTHRQTHRSNDTYPPREKRTIANLLEASNPRVFTYQNCPFITHVNEPQYPSEIPPLTIHHQKVHSDHRRHRRLRLMNHNLRRRRNAGLLQDLHVLWFRPLVRQYADVPSASVSRRNGEADGGDDGGGGGGASMYNEFGIPAGGHSGKKLGDAEFFEIIALKTIRKRIGEIRKSKIKSNRIKSAIRRKLTDLIVSMKAFEAVSGDQTSFIFACFSGLRYEREKWVFMQRGERERERENNWPYEWTKKGFYFILFYFIFSFFIFGNCMEIYFCCTVPV